MRSRRIPALVAAALLAFAATGCGGDALAPQVPGPPADVTIPDAGVTPSADGTADGSGDASTDTDADATATATATAAPSGTGAAEPDASGGTAAPETDAQADSPTNDTAPPAGSDAQQFEDFCAANPGAC